MLDLAYLLLTLVFFGLTSRAFLGSIDDVEKEQ